MLKKIPFFIFYILGLLPVFLLFYSLQIYGVNAPHWDDHALRVFVDKYQVENSFIERLKLIFAYHNEHRIALTRLSSLITFKALGFLDFKVLQYIGFAGLIGLLLVFVALIRRLKLHPVHIFIVGLLIFNFSTVENLLWGMAAIQNFWILFLSFATFFILSFSVENNKSFQNKFFFGVAILFAVSALFTSGNGILVPVLGLLILLSKKLKTQSIIWAVTFVVFLSVYFIGYGEIPSKVVTVNMQTVKAFLIGIASSFYFDEGVINFSQSVLLNIGIVLLILALIVMGTGLLNYIQIKIKKANELLFFTSSALFIAGTLAVVCINRIHFDPAIILTSKYKIYSFLAICLLIVYLGKLLQKNIFTAFSLLLSLILFGGSYLGYFKYFEISKGENMAFILNNYNTETLSTTSYKPYPEDQFLIINFDETISEPSLIDSIKIKEKVIALWENENFNSKIDHFVIAKNDRNINYVAMGPKPNLSISSRLLNYYADVYTGDLNLLNFPSGIYQLYYLKRSKNEAKLYNVEKTIRITGVKYEEDAKNW